ncbi:hypothetical protein [Enterococcus sp. HY326]|uniref:hypothetical protein n=1 Tax=Enterococcus sp. HY326 TaxID=2971265 RepID=UPI00223EFDF7|nr:hypothetical protein [Enterococcus sp. HY326]
MEQNNKPTVIKTNLIDNETKYELPNVTLVLTNGQDLIDEIKKAQLKMAELNEILNKLQKFSPEFHQK